jgi:hypothetical protein
LRIPVHGSGFSGGKKRLAPEVDAPYGTPLKMYTPFRSNPRIFPALVSTTVAASEQRTLLRPQGAVVGCGPEVAAAENRPIRFVGAMDLLVSPAQDAAMLPKRARLPFAKGVKRSPDVLECDCFSKSFTVLLLFRKMQRRAFDELPRGAAA